jgi:hypothetical protein
MSTQPRMSAPIGRLQIQSSESRKRSLSGTGRWTSAGPPADAELDDSGEAPAEEGRRRYYPFAPNARDDGRD